MSIPWGLRNESAFAYRVKSKMLLIDSVNYALRFETRRAAIREFPEIHLILIRWKAKSEGRPQSFCR
jgi:hypothetical protein